MGKKSYLDYEEEFHEDEGGAKRNDRLERKLAQKKDRSKYKKSDQDKRTPQSAPQDPNLKLGRVLKIYGETAIVLYDNTPYETTLKGALKKEKGLLRNLITVGDFVRFYPQTDGLSSIVHVEPRRSLLSRREHFKGHKEQLLASNIDQVFIVASLFEPILKASLIDRYIIAAQKGQIEPIVVINKCDYLESPPDIVASDIERERALFIELCRIYEALHIPLIKASVRLNFGLDEIKERMKGKASVFSGQSGVGKTSLINAVTGLDLTVGDVVAKTRKGAHTTTTAQLIPLEDEAFIIDTPGIKSFGMWDLSPQDIQNYFSEIKESSIACKFPNCSHTHEPGCAVQSAVEEGKISELRFNSYLSLLQGD